MTTIDHGAAGSPPKPGTVDFARHAMLAALQEVGIDTTAAVDEGVNYQFDHDPKLYWRAANIGREAIGLDEWPWDEWCEWHRQNGPQVAAWLDHWGAP